MRVTEQMSEDNYPPEPDGHLKESLLFISFLNLFFFFLMFNEHSSKEVVKWKALGESRLAGYGKFSGLIP